MKFQIKKDGNVVADIEVGKPWQIYDEDLRTIYHYISVNGIPTIAGTEDGETVEPLKANFDEMPALTFRYLRGFDYEILQTGA